MLVLGWGSTYGPIAAAARSVRNAGAAVAQAHLRHLNPFPANTGEVLRRYDRVLVPEMNLGQLALLLRAKYLVDVHALHPGARAAVHAPSSSPTCCTQPRPSRSRPDRRTDGAAA